MKREIDAKEHKMVLFAQGMAAKVTGGIVGGATSFVTGNPILGAVLGASIAHSLENVGREVVERHLAPRQEVRVGRAIAVAYQLLEDRLQEGRQLRDDDFFRKGVDGRSSADELTEAALQAAMNSAEERKVDFIGALLANIALDSSIGTQTAHVLLEQAQRLTFRSYIVLHISAHLDTYEFPMRHLQEGLGEPPTIELKSLELEVFNLIRSGLLVLMDAEDSSDSYAVLGPDDVDPGRLRLTEVGYLLHDKLELERMDKGALFSRVVEELHSLARAARFGTIIDGGTA